MQKLSAYHRKSNRVMFCTEVKIRPCIEKTSTEWRRLKCGLGEQLKIIKENQTNQKLSVIHRLSAD